jgi:hypothetical protein
LQRLLSTIGLALFLAAICRADTITGRVVAPDDQAETEARLDRIAARRAKAQKAGAKRTRKPTKKGARTK